MKKLTFIAGLLLATPALGHAAVVTQYTGGTASTSNAFLGESFTTPLDFLYSDLTFDFYSDAPATTPTAAGTAFILSQPYAGMPSALGLTTPGLLAASTSATGGIYSFNPGLILATNTTYYLYTNAAIPTATRGNGYAGGSGYATSASGTNFTAFPNVDFNFTLNGTVIGLPVPEPSTLVLGAVSAVAGVGLSARVRRTRA